MPPSEVQKQRTDPVPGRGRVAALLVLVLLAYAGLAGRLVQLQVLEHDGAQARADRLMQGTRRTPGPRARIVDRADRPLAVSVRGHGCAVDPARTGRLADALMALSGAMDLESFEVARVLEYVHDRRAQGQTTRFAWVRRVLTPAQTRAVRELDLAGVLLPEIWVRRYPGGTSGCHLVGFANVDGVGQQGVEREWDEALSGAAEEEELFYDARRRVFQVAEQPREPAEPAQRLRLSLDAYIQRVAERALEQVWEEYQPRRAGAVVMDPYTGDVLAMAALPAYDPNAPAEAPTEVRLNPAVAAVYEPGSVFKPFVLAAALDREAVALDTPVGCEGGTWNLGFRVLHDVHGYGTLTASEVVVKSSNIGIAKVAARLGAEPLYESLRAFGFGTPTGADLCGEVGGMLRPVETWNRKFAMTSLPMGQEIAVTPLQLATAFSALVNGGILVRPRVAVALANEDGVVQEAYPVQPVRRVIAPRTSAAMRRVLARVVREGTGRRAQSGQYTIGGKTGTAQIAERGGYAEGKYVASFCGFGPVDTPRALALVSVTEPKGTHYGGTVAAPAVRSILEAALLYLKVPPRAADADRTRLAVAP